MWQRVYARGVLLVPFGHLHKTAILKVPLSGNRIELARRSGESMPHTKLNWRRLAPLRYPYVYSTIAN